MHELYLGSQSKARQNLLTIADIPYQILTHKSNECGIKVTESFNNYVLAIAQHKMQHLLIPHPSKLSSYGTSHNGNPFIFTLTADTLLQTASTKKILGKPKDMHEAKAMHQLFCKEPLELATACCLEKKEFSHASWKTIEKNHWVTNVTLEFCVEQDHLDRYFEKMPHALNVCGAGIVEDYGLNFLKCVNGSYTAILGLPLFELRIFLKKMNFWE